MGFRFQRRLRLFPGLRLNLSKGGVSASVGGRGAWYTFGRGRQRATIGLPGTGISYTATNPTGSDSSVPASSGGHTVFWLIVAAAIGLAVWYWVKA